MITIKRLLFGFSAVALATIFASTAQAQAHFGVSAGLSVPTSTFGDDLKTGYNATAMLGFSLPMSPIGIRAELGYNSFEAKGGGGKAEILNGTGNIVLSMPGAMVAKPYFIGGLGAYREKATVDTPIGSFSATQTKLGFNGGVGLSVGLTGFQTLIEARYVYITADSGDDKVQYIPISVGIMF